MIFPLRCLGPIGISWLASIAIVACGDDGTGGRYGDDSESSGDTSASTGSASTSTTTSAGTSSTTTATSDGSGSTGGADSGSGTEGSGSGSDGSGSDGSGSDGSTGGQGNIEYSAAAVPGGLDRIRIFKANFDDDLCTTLTLVSPGFGSPFQIDTPQDWDVESAEIEVGADGCGGPAPGLAESALGGSGTVTFGMMGQVFPCALDVDVTLDFAGVMMGIPMEDTMSAAAIPVEGC